MEVVAAREAATAGEREEEERVEVTVGAAKVAAAVEARAVVVKVEAASSRQMAWAEAVEEG